MTSPQNLRITKGTASGKRISELVWTAVLGIAATGSAQASVLDDDFLSRAAEEKAGLGGAMAGLAASQASVDFASTDIPADIAQLIQEALSQELVSGGVVASADGDVAYEAASGVDLNTDFFAASSSGEPLFVAAADTGTQTDFGSTIDWSNSMQLAQAGSTAAASSSVAAASSTTLGFDTGLLALLGVGALAIGASNSDGDSAPAATPNVAVTGKVVDGYVAGAKIFAVIDGVKTQVGTTDAQGNVKLDQELPAGSKLSTEGGVNAGLGDGNAKLTEINTSMEGTIGPDGQIVISPLTTLLAKNPNLTEASLKASLGIPDDVDINTFDPISALSGPNASIAESVFAKAQQVMTLIQTSVASGVSLDDAFTTIGEALNGGNLDAATSAVVDQISSSNPDFAGEGAASALLASLQNINSAIGDAYENLSESIGDPAALAAAFAVTTVAQNEFLDAVSSGEGVAQFGGGAGFDALVNGAESDIVNNVQSLDASILGELLANSPELLSGEKVSVEINDSGDAGLLAELLKSLDSAGGDLGGLKLDSGLAALGSELTDIINSSPIGQDFGGIVTGDY